MKLKLALYLILGSLTVTLAVTGFAAVMRQELATPEQATKVGVPGGSSLPWQYREWRFDEGTSAFASPSVLYAMPFSAGSRSSGSWTGTSGGGDRSGWVSRFDAAMAGGFPPEASRAGGPGPDSPGGSGQSSSGMVAGRAGSGTGSGLSQMNMSWDADDDDETVDLEDDDPDASPQTVPLPGAFWLLAWGGAGLLGLKRLRTGGMAK